MQFIFFVLLPLIGSSSVIEIEVLMSNSLEHIRQKINLVQGITVFALTNYRCEVSVHSFPILKLNYPGRPKKARSGETRVGRYFSRQ